MLINKTIKLTIGIKDHRVTHVAFDGKKILIELDLIRHRHLPCSVCGKKFKIRDPGWRCSCRLRRRRWDNRDRFEDSWKNPFTRKVRGWNPVPERPARLVRRGMDIFKFGSRSLKCRREHSFFISTDLKFVFLRNVIIFRIRIPFYGTKS